MATSFVVAGQHLAQLLRRRLRQLVLALLHYHANICGSRQKCADVNQLPFALQWSNIVIISVRDVTEVPNR